MKRLISGLSVIAILACVCAQDTDTVDESASTDSKSTTAVVAPQKVLLAMEKTAFKKELIDEMNTILVAKGHEVTVVEDHKKQLDEYSAADYDLVFITNSGVNSKVRPWIRDWLSANKQQKSRILLHTTQTRDWEVEVDVDGVTSASAKKDVKSLAAQYAQKLLDTDD